MGRLNKQLSKKLPVKKQPAPGLSSAAAKALLSIKDSVKIPADVQVSAPAPNTESLSFSVAGSIKKNKTETGILNKPNSVNKKVLKTGKKNGKIVKLKKKEKMKLRTGLLVTKLANIEKEKKELKDKKIREKAVIVKDTKPMLDDLERIAEEVTIETTKRELKAKQDSMKPKKSTQKMKKQKTQFMKDIEFLKAASKHPDYVANPIKIISTHIKNTTG